MTLACLIFVSVSIGNSGVCGVSNWGMDSPFGEDTLEYTPKKSELTKDNMRRYETS